MITCNDLQYISENACVLNTLKNSYIKESSKQRQNNQQSHIFLSIHSGQKKKAPITEFEWDRIWIAINHRITKDCFLPNWDEKSRIIGAKWALEKGFIVCTTEHMAVLVSVVSAKCQSALQMIK